MNLTVGFNNPNALSRQVAQALRARGKMTADELEPLFPEYTRRQLHKALMNAKDRGWVWLVRRGSGGRNGGVAGIWAPSEGASPLPQAPVRLRPLASVWELASREPCDKWPLPFDGGRVYVMPEDEEEPA